MYQYICIMEQSRAHACMYFHVTKGAPRGREPWTRQRSVRRDGCYNVMSSAPLMTLPLGSHLRHTVNTHTPRCKNNSMYFMVIEAVVTSWRGQLLKDALMNRSTELVVLNLVRLGSDSVCSEELSEPPDDILKEFCINNLLTSLAC